MRFNLLLVAAGICLFSAFSARAEDTRVLEMRTYYAAEDKLDALHARFRDHTLGLFEKHGIQNIGYWVPKDNKENKLIYIVAYPSREARESSWKAFMEDPDWKKAYAESTADGRLVTKVDSQFMQATDYSPEIQLTTESESKQFELRVYHTNEGKLKGLDARFRDHTMEIFKDQGMENIAYWHLMDDQEGAGSTLIYMLGYKSDDARRQAWEGFGQDPRWKKAYAESTKDGRLVKKVDSTHLVATDYSPIR